MKTETSVKGMGDRIKDLRVANNLTKKDLAELLNVADSTIGRIETGETTPSAYIIFLISEHFSVSADWILKGNNDSFNGIVHANTGHIGVVGQANGPVTIHSDNDKKRELSKEEIELLRIYSDLNIKKRIQLLNVAIELDEDIKSNN